MSLIREDENGLYVVAGGYTARPGELIYAAHIELPNYRVDDGGLQAGDKVKAHHMAGSQVTKLRLDDGTVLFWAHDSAHKRDHMINQARAEKAGQPTSDWMAALNIKVIRK